MPLDKEIVPFPFLTGMDNKTDQKQENGNKLGSLSNAFMETPQQIRKRFGFVALPTTTLPSTRVNPLSGQTVATASASVTASTGIATFKSELVETDLTNLYSYSQNASAMSNQGQVQACATSSTSIYQSSVSSTAPDFGYHAASGLQCFAWQQGTTTGVFYSIRDATTGTILATGALATGSYTAVGAVKVSTLSTGFAISWMQTSGASSLYFATVSVTSPTAVPAAPTTVSSAVSVTGGVFCYDVTVINDVLTYAYPTASGVVAQQYSNAFVLQTTATTTTRVAGSAMSVWGSTTGLVWIAYNDGSNTYYLVMNAALASLRIAETLVAAGASLSMTGIAGPSSSYLLFENAGTGSGSSSKITLISVLAQNTAGVSGTAVVIRSVVPISKAFLYNSDVYFFGLFPGTLQQTYFLVRIQVLPAGVYNCSVSAKLAPSNACSLPINPQLGEVFQPYGTTSFLAALAVENDLVTNAGTNYALYGINLGQVTLATTSTFVETGNNLHINAGYLSMYDGQTVCEQNFHMFPEIISITQAGGGSTFTGGAAYDYVACYEWVDNYGQLHRSEPSLPLKFTPTANCSTLTLTLSTLRVTGKPFGTVAIGIYRSIANQTTFYRVNPVYTSSLIPVNTPSTDTCTFVDTNADSAIIGNQQFYGSSGEVQNSAPPALSSICSYQDRLIGIPSENPYSWWYSKQITPNPEGVPVQFSQLFVNNVDPFGGPLTAVASMDSNLIFFKANKIFYVNGTGPAANGTSNDFTNAQPLAVDCGTTNPASIVLTDKGLIFQAEKGMCLLSRSLETSYVGFDAGSLAGATVTSAVLYSKYNQVRFTLSSSVCLVYDYLMNQWFDYQNVIAVNSCLFEKAFTYVQPGGTIMQESSSVFTDAGAFVPLSLTTQWMSFGNIQDFQRVYEIMVLGDYQSPHSLVVSIAYDFNSTVVQTIVVPVTVSPTGAYQYRIFPARQKCESIQLTIADAQTSNYGEGLRLSDLTFRIGKKQGLNKTSAAQTYG